MVSSLFYYQLALVAIIWLFVMLHLSWPKQSAAPPTAPATPIKPKSKRSTEPKAFEGLTHKPPGALGDQETGATAPAPPRRPEPLPPPPFCSRFFESGHYAHIFTLMHVLVAPAACGFTQPEASPAPARTVSPAPALEPPARVRG